MENVKSEKLWFDPFMHTIADRTSPAHKNEQPWYGTGPQYWPDAAIHVLRELWPSPSQRQDAVNDLRDYNEQFQNACSGD
jgi:hypothetical protein